MHAPPLHTYVASMQSAFAPHGFLHAVAPHTYGAQVVGTSRQAPAPSQFASVWAAPLVQLADEHFEVDGVKWHAAWSVPLQLGPQKEPSPVPEQAGWPATGAPVTGEQVPDLPVRLQASH
jgi:hypothetical protein